MHNVQNSMVLPKVKCTKNSSEIEAEAEEKRELKELLHSLDEVNFFLNQPNLFLRRGPSEPSLNCTSSTVILLTTQTC